MAQALIAEETISILDEDIDVDPTDLDDEVEVSDDVDAWMNEMLSAPSNYDY